MKYMKRRQTASAGLALALSAASACGALRAGELRDLWYFGEMHYFADREQFVIATNVVDRAAKAGYTGCACITGRDNFGNWGERVSRNDGSDYFVSNFAGVDAWWRLSPERQARFRAFAGACRESGVEFIPLVWSVGYGSPNLDDPSRVAAWPSRSMPYAAAAGRAVAVHEAVPVDFSPALGWGCATNASRRAVRAPLKPFRRYRLSCEVKTDGMPPFVRGSQIMILCDANHTLGHTILTMEPTQDWTPVGFGFNPGGQTNCVVHFICNAKSGRFAVRNMRLEAVGVEWPVRREGCPLAVRDAATGRVYEEGRDYSRVPGLDRISFNRPSKEMELALLPGGAIAEGAQLLVDAYEPVFARGVQASSCLVNPGLYDYFDRSAAEIAREFGCRKWFLSLDEVRVECRCELCAKSGLSMGARLAGSIRRMRETILRHRPDAELFMWSDMLDENHNAAPTKGWYYQCETPFAGAWKDVPRDIVMVPWWTTKCGISLPWFSERGFKTLGGSFYDCKTHEAMCENLGKWMDGLLGTPGSRGVMYTTWQNGRNCGNYSFLEAFADEFRRLRAAGRKAPERQEVSVDWRILAADQGCGRIMVMDGSPGGDGKVLKSFEPLKDARVAAEDRRAFSNVDEAKVADGGRMVIGCTSSGAFFGFDFESERLLFYGRPGKNPHSIERLPDGRYVVACSVGSDRLVLVDLDGHPFEPSRQKYTEFASLHGAHGVAWDSARNCLFALGYDVIVRYAYDPAAAKMTETGRWSYLLADGDGHGHDFTPDGHGGYYFTVNHSVRHFDPDSGAFTVYAPADHAKGFHRSDAKGDLYSYATKRYWAERAVVVKDGVRREVPLPEGSLVYKFRWLNP